jgi:hypothetical protein
MTAYERIEAARKARSGFDPTARRFVPPDAPQVRRTFFRRTDFAVGRLYDDGRFVPHQTNLTRDAAEILAGRKRDGSSDDEVKTQLAECWTWNYRQQKGNAASNGPKKSVDRDRFWTKRRQDPTP